MFRGAWLVRCLREGGLLLESQTPNLPSYGLVSSVCVTVTKLCFWQGILCLILEWNKFKGTVTAVFTICELFSLFDNLFCCCCPIRGKFRTCTEEWTHSVWTKSSFSAWYLNVQDTCCLCWILCQSWFWPYFMHRLFTYIFDAFEGSSATSFLLDH